MQNASKIKKAAQKILENIKPTRDEELRISKIVSNVLNKIKIRGAEAIYGGSGAKGTWLRGTHDIDIYVKFNYKKFKNKSDKIAELLYRALVRKFKVSRLHGSRDYFQIKQKGFTFEIVPILNIKKPSEAKNLTDFSQLHVEYVKKYNKRYKHLADDIRIAKAFAQARGVYGAESYIQGFSGYVLELLVIHYKSFLNLVKEASKWSDRTIIGSKKLAEKLNRAKTISPLILIDPVQPDRNAAAALSKEKYHVFILSCKKFLTSSSPERLFEKERINLVALKESGQGRLVLLDAIPKTAKKDIAGAKLLTAFNFLKTQLSLHDFNILKSGWNYDGKAAYYYFLFDKNELTKFKRHYGPPLTQKKGLSKFRKKYNQIYVENNRVYTTIERKYTKPEHLIADLLQTPNIKLRVKSITIRN